MWHEAVKLGAELDEEIQSVQQNPTIELPALPSPAAARIRSWVSLDNGDETDLFKYIKAYGAHPSTFLRSNVVNGRVSERINSSGLFPSQTDDPNWEERFRYLLKQWKQVRMNVGPVWYRENPVPSKKYAVTQVKKWLAWTIRLTWKEKVWHYVARH